jgi:hypothetical protein
MNNLHKSALMLTTVCALSLNACYQSGMAAKLETANSSKKAKYLSPPLISNIYTADPSAHVFDGKIYIYPSHDI